MAVSTFILVLAVQVSMDLEYREHSCEDPQNQHGINACALRDFEGADAELNRLWPQVVAAVREQDAGISRDWDERPSGEERLREAQRAWIIFRDAHCAVESFAMRGGSAEPLLYNGCRARLTRERIAQLRAKDEQ